MTERATHRFAHHAMNTTFEVFIADYDATLAASAAHAAFALVNRIESMFSIFRADSDVARINRAQPGDVVRVSPETTDCLKIAQDVYTASHGAFDPTIGAIIACGRHVHWHWENVSEAECTEARTFQGMNRLDCSESTVVRLHPDASGPVCLDLGAIGKGFSLDVIAEILRNDWDVTSALLSAGGSSILTLGDTSWPIGTGGKWGVSIGRDVAHLRHGQSLSGSGFEVQGRHIIDARLGKPITAHHAAWAIASSGALSDAWSTAFLVLDDAAVQNYCSTHTGLGGLLVTRSTDTIHRVVSTPVFDACAPLTQVHSSP